MPTADFTVEVRDRDFQRLGQIAPEYTDLKFVDVFNGVGTWEMKLPAEHPQLVNLKTKGAGIVVTEHWLDSFGVHQYRVYSGRMRSAQLSQNAADPTGTWLINGVHDNVIAAATLVFPDPANDADSQTESHWTQAGPGETVMKQAVQLNAGSAAIAVREYPWLAVAPDLVRGLSVKCSSRFDTLGDLLSSLGTAAGLGWRFAQTGDDVTFDVFEPADKTKLIRLDIRNGGVESNELGFTAPSVTDVLVMGQGEGAERTILPVTSTAAQDEADAWGIRWEMTKDQRQTDDPVELEQAGTETLEESGTTVNSLKVVPSNAPNMQLGIDWYIGDRITVTVEGQETQAIVTQVATSITSAGVIRQATIGDPVGFDFDAKMVSKVKNHEKRIGQVERLIGQGVSWSDITNVPAGAVADTGDVKMTALRAAPAGWLLMRGQSVSRTTYADLFNALNPSLGAATITIAAPAVVTKTAHGMQTGQAVWFTTTGALPSGIAANTTYYVILVTADTFRLATSLANAEAQVALTTTGSQSGTHTLRFSAAGVPNSTNFYIPDMQGMTAVGLDGAQEEFNALGQSGGAKTHTLTAAQLPNHQHMFENSNSHSFSWGGVGGTSVYVQNAIAAGGAPPSNNLTTSQGFWNRTATDGGGGQAHNILQPYRVLNFLIKT
ncbi:minor tail protein [Microbacterium phage Franklin22]|uniref:minor tail protein n=1 Tax=Microbacterium phage Franklin22 TaxID=2894293 RepID=UPI001E7EFEFD|nr:minor tail protein [Microbacterium phage Franklin22]UGL61831.1 minor tail protein [Microbacterium phage Franklin22]